MWKKNASIYVISFSMKSNFGVKTKQNAEFNEQTKNLKTMLVTHIAIANALWAVLIVELRFGPR